MIDLAGLPAADRVREGLRDIEAGRVTTTAALWLAAAPTRLRELGLPMPTSDELPAEPELAFYRKLEADGVDDPYYRYNAMRAELDSFISMLTLRRRNT